jgi:hypothetical protein
MTIESDGYGTYGVGFRILRRKNRFRKPQLRRSETKAVEVLLDRLRFLALLAKNKNEHKYILEHKFCFVKRGLIRGKTPKILAPEVCAWLRRG